MALLKRWDFNVPIGHKKLKPFGAVKAQRGNQRQRLFDFPFSFFFYFPSLSLSLSRSSSPSLSPPFIPLIPSLILY